MKRAPNPEDRLYTVARRADAGRIIHFMMIPCSCPGCSAIYEKRCQKNAPFPTLVIARMATRAGWSVDPNRAKSYCPAHAH